MIRRILLWFCLPALASAEEKAGLSLLRFANQDQISGSLVSLTGEQVIWDSALQMKPAAYWLKEVLELTLPAETPDFKATHEATLVLARGDAVRGQVAAVTDEFVELDTWFAGRMKFPRVMVRELRIADRPALVFRGPSSMDGWTQSASPAGWKFQTASLRSSGPGSIARNVGLPDEFRMSFDAAWQTGFNMSVIFFSDNIATESPANGYELTFQRRSVRLQRCGTHNFLGNTQNAVELQEGEKARIEIRASVKTKMICFFVNDRIVEIWNDPALDRETLGKGIHFVSQDNGPLKISGIEIAAWDGVIEETPARENGLAARFRDLEGPRVKPEPANISDPSLAGRMIFRNGDSIAGEVVSISDGMITLKTSFDEVKLPVSRLRTITLKPAGLEEPKRMNGDVRGWFADGSSLVFRLDQVGKNKISGFSQNFGTAEFDVKAFNRLEFNIYSAKFDGFRHGGDW